MYTLTESESREFLGLGENPFGCESKPEDFDENVATILERLHSLERKEFDGENVPSVHESIDSIRAY